MTVFERIYLLTKQIPKGKVLTYGQIGKSVGKCPARIVGYAMSSAPEGVPWQRVVNRKGEISERNSIVMSPQQEILEAEGIIFINGRLSLKSVCWCGPTEIWLKENLFNEIEYLF